MSAVYAACLAILLVQVSVVVDRYSGLALAHLLSHRGAGVGGVGHVVVATQWPGVAIGSVWRGAVVTPMMVVVDVIAIWRV